MGKAIRGIREHLKLTQEKFAAKLGVTDLPDNQPVGKQSRNAVPSRPSEDFGTPPKH